jgi:hypothetical protein
MDILFAPDHASKPRSGNARSDHTTSRERHELRRSAFDRETFIDVLSDAERLLPSAPARTEQIQVTRSKNRQRANESCANYGAVTELLRWT